MDTLISIRGITPVSNTPPGGGGPGRTTNPSVSLASHAATAVGDYLLVLASVDFSTTLAIDSTTGVEPWQQIAAVDDSDVMQVRAWLGEVTTAGARTVTVRQELDGASGLHLQVWTLDAGGDPITVDGVSSAVDRTSPFTHAAISPVGDTSLLVCQIAAVQFAVSQLEFGAAPAGMTVGCEHYFNQWTGQQSCYEFLGGAGGTGSRAQTANTSMSGGARMMFALRAEATTVDLPTTPGVLAVTGPEPTVVDPTLRAFPDPGVIAVTGPQPTLTTTTTPDPGTVAVTGPAPTVAYVLQPVPGVIAVTGPAAFAGGYGTEPGVIAITGPAPTLAYAGEVSQRGTQTLPPAQPTRVILQKIRTGEFLHWDLPVEALEITETLSGPQVITGEFSAEIPDLIDLDLEPWGTWVHIEEDGLIRASGILLPDSVDTAETRTFDAIGPGGYPKGIPYVGDFALSGTDPATGESGIGVGLDPADIVRDIWAHVQSYPDGDLGVTVLGVTGVLRGTPPEEVDFETGAGEQVHFIAGPYSKLDWWEAQDCGGEIDSLAKETPFDWVERQAWNTDRSDVDHWIEIGWPRLGNGTGNALFAEGQNIVEAVGPEEPDDRYASAVIVLGKGEGSSRVRGYAGQMLGTRLRRVALIDDKSVESTHDANRRATAELLARQALVEIPEVVAAARHDNALRGTYTVGDDVTVEADVPWIGPLRLHQRITQIAYSPGGETVKLTMRASSSFHYGGPASG